MAKILVDMERIRTPYSGLGQFCHHLGNALLQEKTLEIELEFLLNANAVGYWGTGVQYRTVLPWERWLGVNNGTDLWHSTHQDSAWWPASKMKTVLTVHDLNFLEREDYGALKKRNKINRLQWKIDRSSVITYVSEFVRSQVNQHFKIPNHIRQTVVYNGNNIEKFGERNFRAEWPVKKPFFFSIGIHPKKNYKALLPVLKNEKGCFWLIAGADSRNYQSELIREAQALGCADRLVFTGPVTEQEKCWLFEHCEALFFPSKSEGFGLPVIEAMSFGKPVFLSNKTSLPEVGGAEAYYFLNENEAHLKEVVQQGMLDYRQDTEKQQRLKNWAKQFNWQKTADQYLEIYKELIG